MFLYLDNRYSHGPPVILHVGAYTDVYCSSDDDSDDEDETAALMAELAKIKQERAEEKARLVSSGFLIYAPINSGRRSSLPLSSPSLSIPYDAPHFVPVEGSSNTRRTPRTTQHQQQTAIKK